MKKFLKLLLLTFTVVSLVSCLTAATYAHEIDHKCDDYFAFTPFGSGNERMDSNGNFELYFHYRLQSDTFIAEDTTVTLKTYIHLFKLGAEDGIYDIYDIPKEYSVTVYKVGLISTPVGSYVGYSDGEEGRIILSNMDKGKKYFFVIMPTDPNFSQSRYYMKGTGNVSPISLPE